MSNPFLNLIKRKDLPGGYAAGTWIMSASPVVIEALGCAGFDWGVVDMEHSPLDIMGTVHMLQACAGTPMIPVTRIPWNDAVVVKRMLDAGAQTLLFPFVQNAQEAQHAVAAAKYPPSGIRGMAAMSRASRFGTKPNFFKTANDDVAVIVQIETTEAVVQAEAIASTPGIDALFIGPGDLSGTMGHVGDLTNPAVMAEIAKAIAACHRAGKPIGTVGGTPEVVATYRKMGFDFIACGSDLGLLMRNCAATLSAMRAQVVQPDSQPQGY